MLYTDTLHNSAMRKTKTGTKLCIKLLDVGSEKWAGITGSFQRTCNINKYFFKS